MNDVEAFLSGDGALYRGLFPMLYADNATSKDARSFDSGSYDRALGEIKFKQRRKESKYANPFL